MGLPHRLVFADPLGGRFFAPLALVASPLSLLVFVPVGVVLDSARSGSHLLALRRNRVKENIGYLVHHLIYRVGVVRMNVSRMER